MSIELQKQIRDNGTDIRAYFKDLNNWTREMKTKQGGSLEEGNEKTTDEAVQQKEKHTNRGELSRDSAKDMRSYYEAWERLDADDECNKVDYYDTPVVEQKKEAVPSPLTSRVTGVAPERQKINIRRVASRKGKMDYAVESKERGNAYYKRGQHKSALREYRLGLTYLTGDGQEDEERDLTVTLYNNISAVHCKLSEYADAVKAADDALKINPTCSKSFYRRGYALTKMKRWRLAKRDLEKSGEFRADDHGQPSPEDSAFTELKEFVDRQVEGQKLMEREEAIRMITNTQRKVNEGKLVKIFVSDVKEKKKTTEGEEDVMVDESPKDESSKEESKPEEYVPKALRIRKALGGSNKRDDALKKALGVYYS
ncbi:RNA polymerase II-associated protein 3 [Perkinsus olseni]|uniref:RNA polymerase II-associated protein 3 n=1 Tax=Perkinsus olseni TaxID=32597 RepID=A0A7J6QTF1_PEROL|nr:RNA polymerase II-associated protein 3 [Perkinsus olseni]